MKVGRFGNWKAAHGQSSKGAAFCTPDRGIRESTCEAQKGSGRGITLKKHGNAWWVRGVNLRGFLTSGRENSKT